MSCPARSAAFTAGSARIGRSRSSTGATPYAPTAAWVTWPSARATCPAATPAAIRCPASAAGPKVAPASRTASSSGWSAVVSALDRASLRIAAASARFCPANGAAQRANAWISRPAVWILSMPSSSPYSTPWSCPCAAYTRDSYSWRRRPSSSSAAVTASTASSSSPPSRQSTSSRTVSPVTANTAPSTAPTSTSERAWRACATAFARCTRSPVV